MDPRQRPIYDRRRSDPGQVLAYLTRYRDLIDNWPAFAQAIDRRLPPCIWANPTRIDAGGLADLLLEEGVETGALAGLPDSLVLPEGYRGGQHWWYRAGLAHAQEAVSQVPVNLMGLAPGQRVLDMCAAPGGKTAQIAFAMRNCGTLIANDFSTDRISALQGNLNRLGVVNVATTCQDAGNWPAETGQFDRVLLDAPCSSEGTLRRNPDLVARLGPDLSARLAARQRAMLRKAVQVCRAGGRVVYSTCTLAPEENELVVRDILREGDGRVRLLQTEVPGLRTGPGVTRWAGEDLGSELGRCIRFWPHHNDTGGFFIAVLEKVADGTAAQEAESAALTAEPDAGWIEGLNERYGLPDQLWERFAIHRQTRRGLHLTAADHAPPRVPAAEGAGLFVLRTNILRPKLSTAGAMFLGSYATRGRLELTVGQRDAYLRRQDVQPAGGQADGLRWGQVIVTFRGYPLGIAVYHRSGTLESLCPSR
jgi:NOL1/NOP2/sun family putative RNA methylase